jgi:hypothetical protein
MKGSRRVDSMTATATACPACGAPDAGTTSCAHCGLRLRREGEAVRPRPVVSHLPVPSPLDSPVADRAESAWPYLLAGAALAPVLTLTPILRYMGWFLASLVHETGHCVASWALGCPAFPAIRLDGHAAAVHGPQSLALAAVVFVGICALAWRFRAHRGWFALLVAAAVVHPLLALTRAREAFFLAAGHLGELAFATVFLWRAGTGGFTSSGAERGLYATLGFYLVARNALLAGGLVWSEDTKATYATNGSFGMENDYVRLGAEVLGWSTDSVALVMLVVTLLTLPAAWALARVFPAD